MNNSLMAIQAQLPKITSNKVSTLQPNRPTYFASLVEQLAKPLNSGLESTAPSPDSAAGLDNERMEDIRTVLQSFLSQYKDVSLASDTGNSTEQKKKAETAWDFIEQSIGKENLDEMLPEGMKEGLAAGLKEWKLEEGIEPIIYLTDRLEQLNGSKKQSSEEVNLETMSTKSQNVSQLLNDTATQAASDLELKKTDHVPGESHDTPEQIAASDYQPEADLVDIIHTGEQTAPTLGVELKKSQSITPINHVTDQNSTVVNDHVIQQTSEAMSSIIGEHDHASAVTKPLIEGQAETINQKLQAEDKAAENDALLANAEIKQLSSKNAAQQIPDNLVNTQSELAQNVISSKKFNNPAVDGIRQQTMSTSSSSVMAKVTTEQMTANNGKVLQNTVMEMMQELDAEIISNNRKPDNVLVALSARQQFAAMMHQKTEVQSKQSAQQSALQQAAEVVSEDSPSVADKSVTLPNLQTSKPEQLIFHLKQAASSQEAAGKELVEKLEQVMLQRSEIRSGAMELSIKLRPHNLGDIQIKLLQQDGQTMVQIMTSSKQAKEMLDANLNSLKHIFAPHQITLMDRTDHLPAGNAERSFEQSKQNGEQAGQQQREQKQERDNEEQSFSEFMSEFERSSI